MYELRKKDNTKAVILKRTQYVKKNRSHRLTTWTELKRTLLFFRDDIAVYSKIIIKWNELQSIINTIQSCMCVVWIKIRSYSLQELLSIWLNRSDCFLFCFLNDHIYIRERQTPYTRETQFLWFTRNWKVDIVTNLFVEDTTEQWKNVNSLTLLSITFDFAALIVSSKTAVSCEL